jgi:CheY-like chemotaxis protein
LPKILVADDDPVVQMTVQRVLDQAGHALVVAENSIKGLAKFLAEGFDLTPLDIFMPGMDRFETTQRVLQRRPDAPIAITSGRPRTPESMQGPDYLTMATTISAVRALPKPFKPATLRAMTGACLTSAGHPTAPVRQDRNAVPNS